MPEPIFDITFDENFWSGDFSYKLLDRWKWVLSSVQSLVEPSGVNAKLVYLSLNCRWPSKQRSNQMAHDHSFVWCRPTTPIAQFLSWGVLSLQLEIAMWPCGLAQLTYPHWGAVFLENIRIYCWTLAESSWWSLGASIRHCWLGYDQKMSVWRRCTHFHT